MSEGDMSSGTGSGVENAAGGGGAGAAGSGAGAVGGGGEGERIENLQIERELQDSYLTYAMSTIMDRALPDVRDGLKPSQRRILVAMNDLNLGPRSKKIKCAKIAGDTSGNYHPHGEGVIYPTLVRMGQDWNMRYPLVDPQGNFGSSDGDPPAAMRYTEARMTAVAMEMLADLELDTVDFQPNYDERLLEPVVLPGKFPNLLVNGSTGIAVGMACELLPHNLGEICDAIVAVLDDADVGLERLMELVPGPDFPTGGIICGRDGIVDGYRTGRGKLVLRARMTVEQDKRGRTSVVVTELPYGVIRKKIVESVAKLAKEGGLREVSGVNDESGREHRVRIVIDLKRDADPELVMNQLYEYTPCQVTLSMINIALVNRQPRTMGLKELIQQFISHRFEVITRRTKHLLKKAQQRGHVLEGLIYAVCDIDEVVRLIRTSRTREEAIAALRQRAFRIAPDHPYAGKLPESLLQRVREQPVLLSQTQAEAIGRLQLIQLVGLEIEKLVGDYRGVVEEIEGYEYILRDPAHVYDIIREDTLEMKEKYADPRRTEITGVVSDFNLENLIAREDVVVTLSHGGYIKRQALDTYRSQGRGGRGIRGADIKEGDFIEHLFVANTHDHLLFFTNRGRVYTRRVFEVPEGSRTSQGRSLANLLEFQPGEKVASVLAIRDFSQDEQFLLLATARGIVKKTALSAYANIRRSGIIAIGLDEGDSLIGAAVTGGKDDVVLGTRRGQAIRFNEDEVRAMGRSAGGVIGARFKREGDEVISLMIVPGGVNTPGVDILTACARGFGKRTPLSDYPCKGRGTQGVINIDAGERNGDVVAMRLVRPGEDVLFMTQKGNAMRTPVDQIRQTGRAAAGVKLIRLLEGDTLVAMAVVERDEAASDGSAAEAASADADADADASADAPDEAAEGPAADGGGSSPAGGDTTAGGDTPDQPAT
ncbi:MAG: DNA gyrase subunit A [Tepidisphaerales bacterium]